ncbi:polysaccharide biosynthesis tyrosine autokinase [Aeromicrobium senzhongii]|uniref:non-specific protein-tyrosine kinase n=1 Tax=Aeromicrobium senzhongii TaxID=2663859 RepID=A0ABX6SUA4_9ACTN|nr:polysaccharide biosynthesis tyrosine autokinase [Aeromicrobium senzhongii]QNL94984.1 polysaccharide biosynthesis tyrosine autokinase [Aeromicrobium senzhongii]
MRAYVKTIQRHVAAILLLGIVGAMVGYLHASNTPPTYRATSRVLLTTDLGGSATDIVQGSNFIQNIVASYVLLANSEMVLKPVIERLDLDVTPKQLAGSVSASSPLNTVVIDVAVTSGDPEEARQIAAGVTRELAAAVSEVSPANKKGAPVIRLTTVGPPATPGAPIAPSRRNEVILGALVGLALGLGYALLRRFFGASIRDASDVEEITELPVLGEIVESGRGSSFLRAVMSDRRGRQAESLQGLVTSLSFLRVPKGVSSLVVTSATPGESKSSVAAGLAAVVAAGNKKVLLIDCDLRSPSVGLVTGLESAVGLSNVLSGQYKLSTAVQEWIPNLDVLAAGPIPPNPAQLLSSTAMEELMEQVKADYDFIVLDSAPVLAAADAVWLGHVTDGVLMLARRAKVTTGKFTKALDILEAGHAPVLGVALTRVRRGHRLRYGSDGVYGKRSRERVDV